MESPTIRVIPVGDTVSIVESFVDNYTHATRINWIDGHWVKIRYRGSVGYVFDGFLSHLPPPDHEQQLCFSPNQLITSIDRYLEAHNLMLCIEEQDASETDITTYLTVYDSGLERTVTTGEGWYRTSYTFENTRYSELLSMMRQLLVGENLRNEFEGSLIFHTGPTGRVSQVNIEFGDFPITMEITPDDLIHLSTTVYDQPGLTSSN